MDQDGSLNISYDEWRDFLLLAPSTDIHGLIKFWRHSTVSTTFMDIIYLSFCFSILRFTNIHSYLYNFCVLRYNLLYLGYKWRVMTYLLFVKSIYLFAENYRNIWIGWKFKSVSKNHFIFQIYIYILLWVKSDGSLFFFASKTNRFQFI